MRDPALPPSARTMLAASARYDAHAGLASWIAGYGHGKLEVRVAPVA
jgi:hypothetical protein